MAIETPNVINSLGHFDLGAGAGNEIVSAAGFDESSFTHPTSGVMTIDLDKATDRNVITLGFGSGATNGEVSLTGSQLVINLFDAAGAPVDGQVFVQVLDVPVHV